jgi:pyruvate dehydrogenase E1 component beta subunit
MLETSARTFRDAIGEALREEMRRDPNVIVIGEDVGAAGGVFKQTAGLFEEFGPERVIDTPISEAGAFGIAVGAAMSGLRPVFEVMFGDFMTLVMDQLVNQAAKVSYMSGGTFRVPLVLRTTMGVGGSLGPQHSQGFITWAASVPGLKVVVPSCAADLKGLLKSAIRDDNPVVVFEDRALYGRKDEIPEGEQLVPIGSAAIKRSGTDCSVIAIGKMVPLALGAAETLAAEGLSVEVVDPRSLVPLDLATLVGSVQRTHRALVVDGGSRSFGPTAEIAAELGTEAFDWLDAPVTRLAAEDVPIPFSPVLEALVQPTAQRIADAVRELCR